eukprot:2528864-Rhodomonas_salina.3
MSLTTLSTNLLLVIVIPGYPAGYPGTRARYPGKVTQYPVPGTPVLGTRCPETIENKKPGSEVAFGVQVS